MRSRNLVITLLLVWLAVFAVGAGTSYYRATVHRVKNETTVRGTVSGKASGGPETRGRGMSPPQGRSVSPAKSAP
jgi:hypothetical protein